jgi:hypothetical protein
MGAELLHAGRRTDGRYFSNAPKIIPGMLIIPYIRYQINSFPCCLYILQRHPVLVSLETLRIFNFANKMIVRLNRN